MAETVASCYGDTNIRKKEAGGQNLAYLVQRNQTDSCPSVFMEMQKKSLLEKFLSPARNGAEPRLFILNDEMLTGISRYILCIFLGVFLAAVGFLDRKELANTKSEGFLYFLIMSACSFA